jgi:hypothetical protein
MHRLTDFWKVVRLQALLMLLTVSALGALGEISIRAVHYFWDRTPIDRSMSHLVDQDEMLGWRVAPDKNETYRMTDATGTHLVRYKTGPHGFRLFGNPSTDETKVLIIGDSFTLAFDVSNDQTYYALMQRRLAPTQIFAYGAAGYGTLQEVLFIEEIINLVRPQILVLQVHSNDIINNSYELELASYINNNRHARPYLDDNGAITVRTPQSKLGMAMTVLAYYSRLASWAVHRFDALMAVNAQTRTVENQIQATGFDHPGFQRALRLTERSLSRLRAELPATVKLYAFSADHREPFATAMGALLTQQGFTIIDGVADAIEAARHRGEPVFAVDGGHWSPAGHRIAAGIIGDKLSCDL